MALTVQKTCENCGKIFSVVEPDIRIGTKLKPLCKECSKNMLYPISVETAKQLVTGAIFDFMGYLTSREQTIKVGSSENVVPLMSLLEKWASMRNLDLNKHADVMHWQDKLKT